eukprot:4339463-Prymnesium_polylepis.1
MAAHCAAFRKFWAGAQRRGAAEIASVPARRRLQRERPGAARGGRRAHPQVRGDAGAQEALV